ncbi:MAG: peroxidase family protein [Hyphomonadaceae bacterium]
MVTLVKHDLEFILRQIKISEAHAAGTALTEIYVDAQGNVVSADTPGALQAISDPHLPYGLRTVDGTYNNLIPGRELYGSADQTMPRLLDPVFQDADDNPRIPGTQITSYQQTSGDVYDSDPRLISNLIVDQTIRNPAAVAAALTWAGVENASGAAQEFAAALAALDAAQAAAAASGDPVAAADAQAALDQALLDLAAAETAVPGVQSAYDAALGELTGANANVDALTYVYNLSVSNSSPQEVIDLLAGYLATAQATAATEAGEFAVAESDLAAALAAVVGANDAIAAAQAALDAATGAEEQAALADAQAAYDALVAQWDAEYGITFDGDTIIVPNVSPDEGMSAPFNSWMTLFGQFFDHGLDLVGKGGSGTVYIPLQPDDPLYIPGSPTNFMVLTRATNQPGADGILGTADDVREHINTTTPWIDQNQTYTSHASHQVFLREYTLNSEGKPVATGHLLDGAIGGPATWGETKAQAAALLGIQLVDTDVGNVPLLATDEYGKFIPGANGYAQFVVETSPGVFALVEANPADNGGLGTLVPANAVRTGHAFIDDIAHNAVPGTLYDHDGIPTTPMIAVSADADDVAGNAIGIDARGNKVAYDDELLDAHFVTGDGRGNENIGLTAVHHIFHSEHNRLVEHTKDVVLESGDLAFLNEWLLEDVAALPTSQAEIDALVWDGERLFQAARFTTEMQYQHLVFEEFVRKVQPAVDLFVFNQITDIDPTIVAEFAHVVYRFGHSMLREDVARINPDGTSDDIGLIEAFLNPVEFASSGDADAMAGAIVQGMSRQVGNEIDEFITDALRNNLVGLPLDLAALNIARGRDTGVPSLNVARAQFFEASGGSSWLRPYTSWLDFAQNIKNPTSIINFIAAYGTHESITSAVTAADKRAAATLLVLGGEGAPVDRLDFLNATGAYAGGSLGGLNNVDFWIGGLAEEIMPFGGMLGSTFTFVFEAQMENLQNGDRFYYLTRTQGLNLLNELEANTFSHLAMLNTNIGEAGGPHLPGDLFSNMDYIIELNTAWQLIDDPTHTDSLLQALYPKVERRDLDNDGDMDWMRFDGAEHVVLGGTNEDDTLIGDEGDDTLWGDDGDDWLDGGAGVNRIHGGDGDDMIFDGGDISFLHGEDGDDTISAGRGAGELIFAGAGRDIVLVGDDGKEAFGGTGDDFILGGPGGDFLLGNEGDDWIEGGDGFDTIAGDNSELFFNSTIIGHDVMFSGPNEQDFDAESGDDIMVQGESVIRNEGMLGFDWVTHKGSSLAADIDLDRGIFTTDEQDILRNRYDRVEGASGWELNDVIVGDDRTGDTLDVGETVGQNETTLFGHELTQAGVDRIAGLRAIGNWADSGIADEVVYTGGNILLGGGGSDIIEGQGGDDIMDGDAWLNVRLLVSPREGQTWAPFSVDSLTEIVDRIVTGEIKGSQLTIVREILYSVDPENNLDVAVFSGNIADYLFETDLDGALRIVDTRGIDSSAVGDRLMNFEYLQFADALLPLFNVAAEGAPTIEGAVFREGELLSASALGITDPNGVANADFFFIWEVTFDGGVTWDFAGIGETFTPTDFEVGGLLRVSASFADDMGFGEFLSSAPTPVIADVFQGTNASETWNGTAGDDIANGGSGNDTLNGLAGNDVLNGENGNDILNGGDGDDVLDGGNNNDTINGGNGDDVINYTMGGGTDVVNGGAGNDRLNLIGTAGSNTLNVVFAGGVLTSVMGGAITSIEQVHADMADANDLLDYTTTTANVTVNLTTGVASGFASITSIERATGGSGNDSLTGTATANILTGGGGNDTLNGLDGNDTLEGGEGADTLNGGAGGDTVNGGGGADTIILRVGEGVGDNLNGGGGVDTLQVLGTSGTGSVTAVYNGTTYINIAGANISNIENFFIDLATGTDTLIFSSNANVTANLATGSASGNATLAGIENLTGGTGNDTFTGDAGANTLIGNMGADTLDGGAGNDVLNGGGAADTLIGGLGNDVMTGGGGNDVFILGAGFGQDTITDFDANPAGGQDRLDVTALGITAANFAARVTITDLGADTLVTIDGTDTITLLGVNGAGTAVITSADFILGGP